MLAMVKLKFLYFLSGQVMVQSSCFKSSTDVKDIVQEYTFHVFSIYVDLLTDLLNRLNILYVVSKQQPPAMGWYICFIDL